MTGPGAALQLLFLASAAAADTQHIVLTFQYINGSWVAVVPPAAAPTYTLSTKVIAGIFLSLIFFVSFAGNVLVISTVFSSLTLRRLEYNLLLAGLAVAGLVEAVLNIGLSTAYLLTQPWRLGRTVCQVSWPRYGHRLNIAWSLVSPVLQEHYCSGLLLTKLNAG